MAYTSTTLETLIRTGCNVTIESQGYTTTTLEALARLAKTKDVQLTIKAVSYTSTSLASIARIGGKNITIVV